MTSFYTLENGAMSSPIQNETFKKLIQKARRMARLSKTQKP